MPCQLSLNILQHLPPPCVFHKSICPWHSELADSSSQIEKRATQDMGLSSPDRQGSMAGQKVKDMRCEANQKQSSRIWAAWHNTMQVVEAQACETEHDRTGQQKCCTSFGLKMHICSNIDNGTCTDHTDVYSKQHPGPLTSPSLRQDS